MTVFATVWTDPSTVNGVVSIPLSGRVLQRDRTTADDRTIDDSRPTPALREFVAGPENRLACAALAGCLANLEVGEGGGVGGQGPGVGDDVHCVNDIDPRQNLLILQGPPGAGKSHLAFGLYQEWRRRRPQDTALYITAADFARQAHEALDARTIDAFRTELRTAKLIVLEDLGHLANRTTAQVELMALLDAVADPCEPTAQVVITSRLAPEQISSLAPGLASRLASGVTVSLALPTAETRRELLARLARQRGTRIAEPAIRALADAVAGPAPEVFGALLHLETSSLLDGPRSAGQIDLPCVQQFVAHRAGPRVPSLRGIAAQTARFFSLDVTDLKSPSRRRGVVLARGVAMYLARQLTGKSLEEIGEYFGGRDHTTVLHGCRKLEQTLKTDPDTRSAVLQLHQTLAGA